MITEYLVHFLEETKIVTGGDWKIRFIQGSNLFLFWRWHIAFWYLETHSFCLCGFLSTFYFIKVCWTMTFMAIILQQIFLHHFFFTNNNALFFFLSRSEYRQAMMKNMSSTLVETVSIDYEDFNESFLTCGTCLCKYSYIQNMKYRNVFRLCTIFSFFFKSEWKEIRYVNFVTYTKVT